MLLELVVQWLVMAPASRTGTLSDFTKSHIKFKRAAGCFCNPSPHHVPINGVPGQQQVGGSCDKL
jgi:hypothetical protein